MTKHCYYKICNNSLWYLEDVKKPKKKEKKECFYVTAKIGQGQQIQTTLAFIVAKQGLGWVRGSGV